MTVTTRLCIDYLKSAKVRREQYVGPWLPEPLVSEAGSGSVAQKELGRNPAHSRQLSSRAKAHLKKQEKRFECTDKDQ